MPKSFAGEPLSAVFQKVSGSEKLYGQQRGYQDFPSENICLRVPKTFVGEHFRAVFEEASGSEKLYG